MIATVIRKLELFDREANKKRISMMSAEELEFFAQILEPMSWNEIFSPSKLERSGLLNNSYEESLERIVNHFLRPVASKFAYFMATLEHGSHQGNSVLYFDDKETGALMLRNKDIWDRMRGSLESWPKLGYPDPFLTAERILDTEKGKEAEEKMKHMVELGYFESLLAAEAVYG